MEAAEAKVAAADAVDVLACNWSTVELYQVCQLTFCAGAVGAVCLGIASTEIVAALRLQRLPRGAWHEVAAGVRLMGQTAAAVINQQIRAAANHRK